MQFSIRFLFVMVFACALFLGMVQTAGYFVAAGIVVAISVLVWAVAWRRRGAFLYLRIGAAVFALVAIWFLAVDWSSFAAYCPDCDYSRNTAQYRVLAISVRTQIWSFRSKNQQILEDLGVPCQHTRYEEEYRYRLWGLLLRTRPCMNDLFLLGDYSNDYTEESAAKVRRFGIENPQLAAELHDLVVRKHDYQAFWKTIDDLTGYPPDDSE